ncbi:hypothetical protein WUBG_16807, partial [Wuchereria bancrofti]
YLLTVAKDRRIVIVESILVPTSHRNAVARVLFDVFDAPSVLFAPSHLLATFPFGVSNALVIDVGYSEATVVPLNIICGKSIDFYFRVGYAGEFVPRAIIRTELLDDCAGEAVKVLDDTISEEELYRRLVKFFRELFFKYLLTVAKDRRIVIVESILVPTSHRNAVARVLFDVFDAPSVLFAPSHLLATFPFGVSNALVIDVGYSEATVVPVIIH